MFLRISCKILITLVILVCFPFSKICLAEGFSSFSGIVNSENINVRADSTVSSKIICTVKKGAKLEVVEQNFQWYKIKLPKQLSLYVKKELFECVTILKNCVRAKAIRDNINLRLEPDSESLIVGVINKDEPIEVLEELNEWYRIKPTDNAFGWIHAKFITKLPTEAKPGETELTTN